MPKIKPHVEVNISSFLQSAAKVADKKYPMGVARSFRRIAQVARNDVRIQTKRVFSLHSNFIPQAVLSVPHSNKTLKAAARSVRKYHDVMASVFIRPASNPKKSLAFLIPHELGGKKISADGAGMIASPAEAIENYSYRTPRGKTAKRWKPETLLGEFNEKGPNKKGHVIFSRKKGRGKGAPFLMKGKSGSVMLARRSTAARKPLDFLYSFNPSVSIRPTLHMETTVENSVQRNYKKIIRRFLGRR